jgi:hypothetical protein
VPAYRFHRARGCAVVTVNGHDVYLGPYGSPESLAKYNRLIAEALLGTSTTAVARPNAPYPVGRLSDGFLAWATRKYGPTDGQNAGSVENVRQAWRPLFELFAEVDAQEFGPRNVTKHRDRLIAKGLARSAVNDRGKIVRRAFRWATD